jgi:ankyrin repeat protein
MFGCPGAVIVMIVVTQQNCVLFLIRFYSSGDRPLHRSAYHGRLEICRLLVDARADLQAKNIYSLPPIITMLFLRRNFLFLLLIRLCSSGNQPLHNSAGWGNAAVCRLLVDARADIHAKGWR